MAEGSRAQDRQNELSRLRREIQEAYEQMKRDGPSGFNINVKIAHKDLIDDLKCELGFTAKFTRAKPDKWWYNCKFNNPPPHVDGIKAAETVDYIGGAPLEDNGVYVDDISENVAELTLQMLRDKHYMPGRRWRWRWVDGRYFFFSEKD